MIYNVDLAYAGLINLIVLFFYLNHRYNKAIPSVKQLRRLIHSLIVADILDIITCYTISYATSIPLWVNYTLNIMFFEANSVCISIFPKYIRSALPESNQKKDVFHYINDILLGCFIVICASTPFTHLIFYFDDNLVYTSGTLYLLVFILPLYFLMFALAKLNLNKDIFSRQKYFSVVGFIAFAFAGPALQMTLPGKRIIDFFFLSLAAFIAVAGLETPDFIKLEKTLTELRESKLALEDAVIKAEAADKAKTDFLANMSHEIRTPINAVLGMNELIGRESSEAKIQEYSMNIADAGTALLSLVNDILDFSKIEAGKIELIPAEYQLSILLREINNIISVRCEAKQLSFIIRNNPDIPDNLYGDESRIRQILLNILNNAVKYTDRGSVTLDVNYEQLNNGQLYLIFSVIDTGIGIKEEDQAVLFDSFKRVDLKHNRDREGTGLGLSITKSLIELMDGSIEVASNYGMGSVFTVHVVQQSVDGPTIGLFNADAPIVKRNTYVPKFTAPNARVLIVDDVSTNLLVAKELLKPTLVQVDTVNSGPQCLCAIKDTAYDLILLDHMMPDMDGIDVLRHMKNDNVHINQSTPVIMLTANAINGVREKYISEGFVDYLAKPVQGEELESCVMKHLPPQKIIK